MKQSIAMFVVGGILVVLIAYGCWQLQRTVNYKLGYEPMVKAEIQKELKPLNERIKKLEVEIQILKTNKN